MGVSVSCMWVFRIGASYLLVYSFDMGLLGIWVAMFIDWVVPVSYTHLDVYKRQQHGDHLVELPRPHRIKARHRLVQEQQAARGAQGAGEKGARLLPAAQAHEAAVPDAGNVHQRHVLQGGLAHGAGEKRPAAPAAAGDDLRCV